VRERKTEGMREREIEAERERGGREGECQGETARERAVER